AVKYTAAGRIVVAMRGIYGDGVTQLEVDVEDSGAGIPTEAQTRLFRPFARGPVSGDTGAQAGSGLGLVLARELAQALGGDVRLLRSRVGEGSTFRTVLGLSETPTNEALTPAS